MSHPLIPIARMFDFDGRSRRREALPFLGLAAGLVFAAIGWDAHVGRAAAIGGFVGPLTVIVASLLALPVAAVVVRRLHDGGRSAAALLLAAIPVFGQMMLARWMIAPGGRGANRFGVDPKGMERRVAPAVLYPFTRG